MKYNIAVIRSSLIVLGITGAAYITLSILTKNNIDKEASSIEKSIRSSAQNLRSLVLTPYFMANKDARTLRDTDMHHKLGGQLYQIVAKYEWLTGKSLTNEIYPLYVDFDFFPNIPFWLAGYKYIEYPMSLNPSAEVAKNMDCKQLFLVIDCTTLDKISALVEVSREANILALATQTQQFYSNTYLLKYSMQLLLPLTTTLENKMQTIDDAYQQFRESLKNTVNIIDESTERLIVVQGPIGTGKSTLVELGVEMLGWHYQGINKNDLPLTFKMQVNTSLFKVGAVNVIDHVCCAENLDEVLAWAQNQGKCIIATQRDLSNLSNQAISYLNVHLDYSEPPIITDRVNG